MIDVDHQLAILDAFPSLSELIQCGSINTDHAVKGFSFLGALHDLLTIQKLEFVRNGILIPADHVLPLVAECNRQSQLRTDAITVRAHMAYNAERLMLINRLKDALDG